MSTVTQVCRQEALRDGHSLASEARWGCMWTSFRSTAAGRCTVRSHQASSGRKMYDQAAERARRCGGVAWSSTSAGWAVGLLEVMVPGEDISDV